MAALLMMQDFYSRRKEFIMTLSKIIGITAALALLGLGSAQAEDAAKVAETQKSERGLKPDTNQDGRISFDEFRAAGEKRIQKHFEHMDTNGDGFIDQAEKQAMREKWSEKRKVKGERCNKSDAVKTY
jgi:hypothetical protein